MKTKILSGIGVLLFVALCVASAIPVTAETNAPQVYYYTPTADPNGRIIYIVQPGDTCISISLTTGITLEQLRLLNNLSGDACDLIEGQQLLLGIAEEATPTPGPSPTPTSLLPSPTPFAGNAEVCVYLFEDINGNTMPEETEFPLGNGAISITNRMGTISRTADAVGDVEPVCFDEIPEGEYTVSVAVPEGYNATTIVNYQLDVTAGDSVYLDFGAQKRADIAPEEEDPGGNSSSGGRSIGMALVGGAFILFGLGLGVYVWYLSRQSA